MTKNYFKNDKTFKADLLESDKAVWYVANRIRHLGHFVTMPPIKVRDEDKGDRKDFTDPGDIFVHESFEDLEDSFLIEVKRRREEMSFTSIDSFKYPDIIVDTIHHFDENPIKPRYYVICNSEKTGAIVVPVAATVANWTKRYGVPDTVHGRKRNFYYCYLKPHCRYWVLNADPIEAFPFSLEKGDI